MGHNKYSDDLQNFKLLIQYGANVFGKNVKGKNILSTFKEYSQGEANITKINIIKEIESYLLDEMNKAKIKMYLILRRCIFYL